MLSKISYKPVIQNKQNIKINNHSNYTNKIQNNPTFGSFFFPKGGSVLCVDTAELVREITKVMKEKKIEKTVVYAPDGTKITYENLIFWQNFRFENKRDPFFVTKYGKDDITCRARGGGVQEYTLAPYLDEEKLQKGTPDVLLINYLPYLLNSVKNR